MGNDDLFHKERAKTKKKLLQSRNRNAERIVFVTEGEKTEPNYLESLVKDLGIHKLIHIDREAPTCPFKLVKHAIENYQAKGYKKVYCVFDKDKHKHYQKAINLIDKTNQKHGDKLQCIDSDPCFEFWLILHFENTDRSFGTGHKTPSQDAISYLKNHGLSKYEKGQKDVYWQVKSKQNEAIQRAKNLDRRKQENDQIGSSTRMYVLVEDMINFSKKNQ